MKSLASICLALFALPAVAAAPNCQTQTIDQHTSKLCIAELPFQHDYYTLWVDNAMVLSLPDDYVEDVSLTHTIPEDAGVEFPLSKQGTPTVTIKGGCLPVSEKRPLGSKMVGVEVARVCSFKWGDQQVLKDLRFNLE
ncbi:conserved exported protein of unknown function [Pararobbsia alpina]|uniref:hypothetical protein n=1 Tax=Pararobbsia alpina TaxID=621374 RepID=UPI0039A4016E